jgi:SnoaL-like domain
MRHRRRAAGTVAALARRLRRLEDVEAARGLFQTYAHVLDTPDPETVTALFTADAVLTTALGVAKGHDEIRAFFVRAFEKDPSIKRHFIVNPRATWLSEGRVRIESYFLYVGRGTGASIIGWGTYDDVIDVSGPEPLFAAKIIDVHVGSDLATGWPLDEGSKA